MCGRYGLGHPARLATLPFGAALPDLAARFNIAPSTDVLMVRETAGARDAMLARWGLVPYWASDPAIGHRLANARGETVATKPAFRDAFAQRRALLPADLFYEWQVVAGQKAKQPWCIRAPHGEPFAFGAIWDQWTPRNPLAQTSLISCAIITTEPNDIMRPIHDRMPVILAPDNYAAWLNPRTSAAVAQSLLRPYAGVLEAHRVSTHVNAPRNDDAECCRPLPE